MLFKLSIATYIAAVHHSPDNLLRWRNIVVTYNTRLSENFLHVNYSELV